MTKVFNQKTQQLQINPPSFSSCAFTGHRELKEGFSLQRLENAIDETLQRGARTFYNGLAVGFDLLAAETLLKKKKAYPDVRLVGCIPFENQARYYSPQDKKRYEEVLRRCDERVILYERYTKECYFERNRFMCDRADCLIAYCTEKTGGTAYTVKYFQKQKPNDIFFI